jgi:hypothetical protein
MDWRRTALVPENAPPDPRVMESIAATIPADRLVVLACRTGRFEMAGWVARMATVILTDRT